MSHALSLEAGICYVRVHDGILATPIDVPPEQRSIRWYQVRQPAGKPDVLLVAAGFMTGQAASAANLLAAGGISASVISVVQPSLAGQAVADAGEQGIPVLTVYDGLPDVLGNPVLAAKATCQWSSPVRSLGFRRGTSGQLDELLAWAGLDGDSIARSVAALLAGESPSPNPARAGAHG